MIREELKQFIHDNYSTDPDYPWEKYPLNAVFRHNGNKKWFALIMEVSKRSLRLPEDGLIDVVNFKCDPVLIGSLITEPGFFSAYHMNKNSWITAALDGSADEDRIRMLLDMSYDATAPKIKNICHRKR